MSVTRNSAFVEFCLVSGKYTTFFFLRNQLLFLFDRLGYQILRVFDSHPIMLYKLYLIY